jgi:hypothetical protein
VQPINISGPGLEPMVPILDEEHPTVQMLQMWICSQPSLEEIVHFNPQGVPIMLFNI